MDIKITGDSKEIADFVLRTQNQPSINAAKAAQIMIDEFNQTFAAIHDTDEEYCAQIQKQR